LRRISGPSSVTDASGGLPSAASQTTAMPGRCRGHSDVW